MNSKILLLVPFAVLAAGCGPAVEERALSKEEIRKAVAASIVSVRRIDTASARVIANERLRCDGTPAAPEAGCLLRAGDSMTIPDHHGVITWTVTKLNDDGLLFDYRSRFDHRSFGKNLITETRAEISVPWTPQNR